MVRYAVGLGFGAWLAVYCVAAQRQLGIGRDLVTFDTLAILGRRIDKVIRIKSVWKISPWFLKDIIINSHKLSMKISIKTDLWHQRAQLFQFKEKQGGLIIQIIIETIIILKFLLATCNN